MAPSFSFPGSFASPAGEVYTSHSVVVISDLYHASCLLLAHSWPLERKVCILFLRYTFVFMSKCSSVITMPFVEYYQRYFSIIVLPLLCLVYQVRRHRKNVKSLRN